MAKFKTGDKVTVIDCDRLKSVNLSIKFASFFTDAEVDEIKPDMKGTIVKIYDENKGNYIIDFGSDYKGVSEDGEDDGTCMIVHEDVLKLIEETIKEFKPHLEFVDDGTSAGELGKLTKLKATDGTPLYIGDVVEIDECLVSVVVEDNDGEYFMGSKGMLQFPCFKPDTVFKKFSYRQVWNGDVITGVKYVNERGNAND